MPRVAFPCLSRRLWWRALCVLLGVGLHLGASAIPSTLPASAATREQVATDPAVARARARVRAAVATHRDLQPQLDAAVAAYAQAHAHEVRVAREFVRAEAAARTAGARLRAARNALTSRVEAAYRRPEARASASGALLLSPDAGTLLHRAVLLQVVVRHGHGDVNRLAGLRTQLQQAAGQEHIIRLGSSAAAIQRQESAAALSAALEVAFDRTRRKQEALTDERVAAAARIDAAAEAARARAAAEELRRAAMAASSAPVVAGRVCPVGEPNTFTDTWGAPRSGGRTHQGVDMFAAKRTPVYAADGGSATVGWNTLGGLSVSLTDASGNRYYYAHLDSAAIRDGAQVTRGQVVGAVGNTGNAASTPSHLHWQYHPGGGAPVDPTPLASVLCR